MPGSPEPRHRQKTKLPPGSGDGVMTPLLSWPAETENGVCAPPADGACMAPTFKSEYTIRLSGVQKPPATADWISPSSCDGPPAASTLRSLRSDENRMYRLSGDQNGRPSTPIVDSSGRASCVAIERTQI